MHFLWVNAMFYDTVNMIHDIISTANPFPEKKIEYIHSVVVYEKYLTIKFGRNDNFLAKARKLSIVPTLLDIFDIQQHYIHILYTSVTLP